MLTVHGPSASCHLHIRVPSEVCRLGGHAARCHVFTAADSAAQTGSGADTIDGVHGWISALAAEHAVGGVRDGARCAAMLSLLFRSPVTPILHSARQADSPDAEELSCCCSECDVASRVEVNWRFAEHRVVLELGPAERGAVSRDENELGCKGGMPQKRNRLLEPQTDPDSLRRRGPKRTLAVAHALERRLVAELVLARLDGEREPGVQVVGRALLLLGRPAGVRVIHCASAHLMLDTGDATAAAAAAATAAAMPAPAAPASLRPCHSPLLSCVACLQQLHLTPRNRQQTGTAWHSSSSISLTALLPHILNR